MKTISSAATSSRVGANASPSIISRSAHGLPCAPRATIAAAAPVCSSTAIACSRVVTSPDAITGTDTRSHELRRKRVISKTGVHLRGRAGMERQRRRARLDEPRPDLETRTRAVLDAAPHLHRDRHVDRACDRGDDAARELRILHQVRARARLRHLLDGTAEVHVDDVRAGGHDHPRCLGHLRGIRAEDLDRERMLVGSDPEIAERLLVLVPDPRSRDHLRAHETGTEAASLAAKRLNRDSCHRRENDPRRHLDPADRPRFSKVKGHRPMVSGTRGTIRPRRGALRQRPFLCQGRLCKGRRPR